jgi:hypothetical protein
VAHRKRVPACKQVGFQGSPGSGKTRQAIALTALFARRFHGRTTEFRGQPLPTWAYRLIRAWRNNPYTLGSAPRALPIAVSTPMRVTTTWEREFAGTYPEAEVLMIETFRDVDEWMRRAAISTAPIVVGVFSQSKTRAFSHDWTPAVIERTRTIRHVTDDGIVVEDKVTNFYCPDCGQRIEAVPGRKAVTEEGEDDVVPVTSITYFTKKQRCCANCSAPLWRRRRTEAAGKKQPMPTFAEWSAAIEQMHRNGELGTFNSNANSRRIARVSGTTVGALEITLGREGASDFSPYAYMLHKYAGCIAIHLADEAHNARGTNTDIARSIHYGFKSAQTYAILSGTISGGMLDGLYHLLYRFKPSFWKKLGLGWNDMDEAMKRYGFETETVTEHEGDSRKGSGKSDVTVSVKPAPGMSAKLIPMLLESIIFIDAEKDLGSFLPDMEEIPDIVDLEDPLVRELLLEANAEATEAREALQATREAAEEMEDDPMATAEERAEAQRAVAEAEAALQAVEASLKATQDRMRSVDLARAYADVESELEKLAQRYQAAQLAKGMLPRWWSVLPCSEKPYEVIRTERGDWGDLQASEMIFRAPVLATDWRYPLERRLIEHVTAETELGRTVMVYTEQNALRSMSDRLKVVLAAFDPWVLPNNVDPEDREDAIRAAYDAGKKVFIVPYRRVSEGLNLQFLDTIIWYEMAQNHYHREQSNLRIRRLGATTLKKVIYLVYRGTVAHKKLAKLGNQSGAASLFAGDTPQGALVKAVGADRTTLAQMSAKIDGIEEDPVTSDEELKAAFARRSAEANAARKRGRTWVGITDTLPQRLEALRATLVHTITTPAVIPPAPQPAPAPVVSLPTPVPSVVSVSAVNAQPEIVVTVEEPTPAIQFGDLELIATVLRKRRAANRAERKGQQQQLDLFSGSGDAVLHDPEPNSQLGLFGL